MSDPPAAGVPVALAGRRAARCLDALSRRPGSVLAVFRRSVYLSDDTSDELVCVGARTIGAGPLNALVDDWPFAAIRPGDPVLPVPGGLRPGRGPVLAARPRGLYAACAGRCAPDQRMLSLLAEAARGFARSDGLAPLVPGVRAPRSPVVARALPAVEALAAWLRGGPAPPPPAALSRLIGLGPGLTPSGDDYLGGMMIGLAACGLGGDAARLAGPVLVVAREATSRIGLAHLRAASAGEGAAALHDALAALGRRDEAALAGALAALDRVGHSSGWDALAGAAAALAAAAERSAAAASAASALEDATVMPASASRAT